MNSEKKEIINQAYSFAKKCHKKQKQVSGKPYFEHPNEVAELLKKWNQEVEVIVAGYLHDVVEDCSISLKELKNRFGKRVAFLVDGMSFVIKNIKGKPKKDMEATYKKFIKYSKKDPLLILVKLADMISNIPNIHIKSNREFTINKSYPRSMTFWIPLMVAVGLNGSAMKIKKEFNKYTNQKIKSTLSDYISKKDITLIKNKISKIKPKEI